MTVAAGCTPASTEGTGSGGAPATTGGASGTGSGGAVPGTGSGGAPGTGSGGASTGSGGATTGTGGRGTGGTGTGTGGAATGTGGRGTGGAGTGTGGASPGTGGGAVGGAMGDPSAEIYDVTKFPRFDLDLPAASVTALNAITTANDPKQDTYVTANFTYDKGGKNQVVMNVGVRIKGEGSFLRFSQKPALKIKFDEFVPDQKFYGLARMTWNNNFDDPSFMAERLAYSVYRAVGVPAPRCNSAQIYINGTFYGVYTNVEAEDKHFIARWFSDDSGNLFEKDGTHDFGPSAMGEFDLETNETANDVTDLAALIATVGKATNPSTYLADLGASLDTAQFLKMAAVEGLVNQWDTYSFSIWWAHNFRIYDDPTTKKFVMIPWGHDLSMKPALYTNRAYIKMFEIVHTSDSANMPVSAGILYQRCLASPACKTAYKDAINQAVTAWNGLGMEAAATAAYNQIKAQVNADTKKTTPNGSLTNAQFDTQYQQMLTTIRGRIASVMADLAAN